MERAIERAVTAVEKLMAAELRAIRVELQEITRRLSRADQVEERVEVLDVRLTAAEALLHAQEHRHHDELAAQGRRDDQQHAWRMFNLPSLILTGLAIVVGIGGSIVVPLLLH